MRVYEDKISGFLYKIFLVHRFFGSKYKKKQMFQVNFDNNKNLKIQNWLLVNLIVYVTLNPNI